jgi:putative colanic acid biosynthesis UDP-glucose lipid carrier transferase
MYNTGTKEWKTSMDKGIKTVESSFVWVHRVIDAGLPLLVLLSIIELYSIMHHDRYLIMGMLGSLIFILSAQATGVYANSRGRSIFSSIRLILKAWLLTWGLLVVIAFLYKDSSGFSRLAVSTWALVTPILFIAYRITIRAALTKYRINSGNARKIAIVGAGKVGLHIAEFIKSNHWIGYDLVAYFDDNAELHNKTVNGIKVLGDLSQIPHYAKQLSFDELYICLPLRAELKIKELLNQLTDSTILVKYIPDFFTFDLMHAKWTELNGIPVISVFDTPLSTRTAQFIKRIEDVVISTIILVMISPLLFLISIGIKLSSPGPILFKQKRYGINGKEIKVYKFRSMTCQDNGSIVKQATKGDARITKFGAFLRRTSLDELPQFYNVIQGKMSIVGPRPHAIAHNEEYRKLIPKYMQRHIVKPGITGWAQINGWRGETDLLEKMEKRVDFDLHYVNNWSVWLDIKIIILTAIKGFINKNAY